MQVSAAGPCAQFCARRGSCLRRPGCSPRGRVGKRIPRFALTLQFPFLSPAVAVKDGGGSQAAAPLTQPRTIRPVKPLAAFAPALAALLLTGTLRAQVPILLNYQGRVVVGTVNFDGSGQFRFALVDPTGNTTTD